FARRFAHVIVTHFHLPGTLVLVRNSRIESDLDTKSKAKYFGPFFVIRRTKGGSYRLAELDGTLWLKNVAAFRVIPYMSR
ncbi:hypothetical protein BD410DRAFT_706245, partial [Rickenella mellea]